MKPTSLYIHIPFCHHKCFYCSFVVVIGKTHYIDDYLDALSKEASLCRGNHLETIYIGGGTPSFMSNPQIGRLIDIIKENFTLIPNCELTLEANPEDIDAPKAQFLSDLGVNRISFGAQSFDNRYLKFLGRAHSSDDIAATFSYLRKAGFFNINLDLMFSFPGQRRDELRNDLECITALNSEHVSLYGLTIEEGTKFSKQKIRLDHDSHQAEHYSYLIEFLAKKGFKQYEVSNFSKPGFESRHNCIYWQGENYIGLGVGAHSHKDGKRFWNTPNLNVYIAKLKEGKQPTEGLEKLTPAQRLMEALLFGLRMNRGVDVQELQEKFGLPLTRDTITKIGQFVKEGFFIEENGWLKASVKGRLVLDELSAKLI